MFASIFPKGNMEIYGIRICHVCLPVLAIWWVVSVPSESIALPCISWRAISVKELCPGSWLVGGWAPRGGWRMWKPTSCMCIPVSKWLITSNNNHLVGGIPTPLKNRKIHPFLIGKPSINGPFPSISHGYVWNHLDSLDPAPTRKTVVLSGDIPTLYRKIWEGMTYRLQYIYIYILYIY